MRSDSADSPGPLPSAGFTLFVATISFSRPTTKSRSILCAVSIRIRARSWIVRGLQGFWNALANHVLDLKTTRPVKPMIAAADRTKLYSKAALTENRSQSAPKTRLATSEHTPMTR